MTILNKPVRRETGAIIHRRPIIIQIAPPDLVKVREKGTRTWYVVSVENIYTLGARKMAEQKRRERIEARKLRKVK